MFSDIVNSYMINAIKSNSRKRSPKFLPITACPQKYVSIAVHGSFPTAITVDDETMNRSMQILGYSLNGIYNSYGKEYYFFQPELIYKPNEQYLVLKIGLYDKNHWKQLKKKKKTI